jgi:hypothetical protein
MTLRFAQPGQKAKRRLPAAVFIRELAVSRESVKVILHPPAFILGVT